MKIHYGSPIIAICPPGTKALTIGERIFLGQGVSDQETILHEVCHVFQYRRFGFFGFLVRWMWLQARHGYQRNPLEIEARNFAAYRSSQWSFAENAEYISSLVR